MLKVSIYKICPVWTLCPGHTRHTFKVFSVAEGVALESCLTYSRRYAAYIVRDCAKSSADSSPTSRDCQSGLNIHVSNISRMQLEVYRPETLNGLIIDMLFDLFFDLIYDLTGEDPHHRLSHLGTSSHPDDLRAASCTLATIWDPSTC